LDKRRTYKKTNNLKKRAENVPRGVFSRVWHEKRRGGGDNTHSAKYMVSIVFSAREKKSKNFLKKIKFREKFGHIKKYVYLCGVKICVLTRFLCLGV